FPGIPDQGRQFEATPIWIELQLDRILILRIFRGNAFTPLHPVQRNIGTVRARVGETKGLVRRDGVQELELTLAVYTPRHVATFDARVLTWTPPAALMALRFPGLTISL